ncbi:MAG: hypothetical protein ABSE75_10200 [Acidimicrobiales bacterium]
MTSIDEKALASRLFNRCWELLEQDERSEDDVVELLTSALTSRFHWLSVGGLEQWIIADWMVARAAGVMGSSDIALRFALRAYEAARANETPDWLVASSAEGVARAYAVAGNVAEFTNWAALAGRLVEAIVDPENRGLIESQLADIPTP